MTSFSLPPPLGISGNRSRLLFTLVDGEIRLSDCFKATAISLGFEEIARIGSFS